MIELGRINTLIAFRSTTHGIYLVDKERTSEVLLPNKFVTPAVKADKEIDVFIFTDGEDRPTATTERPLIQLFDFAALRVVDVNKIGAFLDWGLEKHLLVPYSEQAHRMQRGEYYLAYMYHDLLSDRLVASTRLQQFLEKDEIELEENQEVEVMFWEESDLGMKVIVEKKYAGLVYHNDFFKNLKVGETTKGFVDKIREDGKIDIRLRDRGYRKLIEPNAKRVIELLEKSEGFIALTDKSAPELIQKQLGMSKKNFKRALGNLYKQRLVRLEKDGTYLMEN
ncbi:MAG: S1 RNA-binding domain-containing protein [Saprospiraceae bacterium]